MMKEIKLSELVGIHYLSGVDVIPEDDEQLAKIIFILDGVVYEAVEDYDEYDEASWLDGIYISNETCVNRFSPLEVNVSVIKDSSMTLLIFNDDTHKRTVMYVGTDNTGPYCLMNFFGKEE